MKFGNQLLLISRLCPVTCLCDIAYVCVFKNSNLPFRRFVVSNDILFNFVVKLDLGVTKRLPDILVVWVLRNLSQLVTNRHLCLGH